VRGSKIKAQFSRQNGASMGRQFLAVFGGSGTSGLLEIRVRIRQKESLQKPGVGLKSLTDQAADPLNLWLDSVDFFWNNMNANLSNVHPVGR